MTHEQGQIVIAELGAIFVLLLGTILHWWT